MAFSAPAADEADLVLDFGTLHDLYAGDGHRGEIEALAPGLVLRCIGLGEVCQSWGGLLSGLHVDPRRRPWTRPGANQGALIVVMRLDLFGDADGFKRRMDEYVRSVARLEPLGRFSTAYLAGGREEALLERYLSEGVPVGPEHRADLETIAGELQVDLPW